jgi:hypothetical protein
MVCALAEQIKQVQDAIDFQISGYGMDHSVFFESECPVCNNCLRSAVDTNGIASGDATQNAPDGCTGNIEPIIQL